MADHDDERGPGGPNGHPPGGAVPQFSRIADILCPTHRGLAATGLMWPFPDTDLDTPRATCRDCGNVTHDFLRRLSDGQHIHVTVFTDLPEHHRHRLYAAHEAGHVVADIAHGLPIISAYVTTAPAEPGELAPYNSGVTAERPATVSDADYAVTLMAGTAATESYLSRLDITRPDERDRVDLSFQSHTDVGLVQALGVDPVAALDQARAFVTEHAAAVDAVSQHLHTHQAATGTELVAVCGDLNQEKQQS